MSETETSGRRRRRRRRRRGARTTSGKSKNPTQRCGEQFLQWEYDINRYEKDNGTALPDGVKTAILRNKTKGALQQHLQLRAGQITNYNEIRVVILDYYKTISAF